MRLSILIPTFPARVEQGYFKDITQELCCQIDDNECKDIVEILGLYDNQQFSVGAKRNKLLQMSRGAFVTFVDDDDWVAPDYIEKIIAATCAEPNAEVICFQQEVTINGGPPKLCKYSLRFEYVETPKLWTGKPAHTMVWHGNLARQCAFPEKSFGEDMDWVKQACALADPELEVQIPKVLYFYQWNGAVTATRTEKQKCQLGG